MQGGASQKGAKDVATEINGIDHEAIAVEALRSVPRDVPAEWALQVAQAAATLALVAEVRALREWGAS